MTQKGEHTWDLIVYYHKCPKCGFLIESREDFTYIGGKYVKEIGCERCGNSFVETKDREKTLGPLIGDPQPVEWMWSK